MLNFDYEAIHDQIINFIRGSNTRTMNDGSVRCDELLIGLGQQSVRVLVNADTDELLINLEREDPSNHTQYSDIPELSDCVGKNLGWCWEGRNYRGYWDMLTISVSGLNPDICLVGEASGIALSRVAAIKARR